MDSITIILQAGGDSQRMGVDKALVPFMGTSLLGYILEQVKTLSDDVILITNGRAGYESYGLPVYSDVFPDWGALGGLHAALFHAGQELCLVLACDMPFIERPLLRHMIAAAHGYDAVIPRLRPSGFTEPFRAVYRKTCLKPIERAIEQGQRRVNSFFDQVAVRYVDQAELDELDPARHSFFNVNTPENLTKARAIASQRGGGRAPPAAPALLFRYDNPKDQVRDESG